MIRKPLGLELDASIVQDNIPVEIVPGVFIGSIHAAFNQEALLDFNVTHVSSCSRMTSGNSCSICCFASPLLL